MPFHLITFTRIASTTLCLTFLLHTSGSCQNRWAPKAAMIPLNTGGPWNPKALSIKNSRNAKAVGGGSESCSALPESVGSTTCHEDSIIPHHLSKMCLLVLARMPHHKMQLQWLHAGDMENQPHTPAPCCAFRYFWTLELASAFPTAKPLR